MAWRPHGRARVNARNPQAFAVCDRCGAWRNHVDLQWQFQWSGVKLQNLRLLVCNRCLDVPQPQLKARVLQPDPVSIKNPRPEYFDVDFKNEPFVLTFYDTNNFEYIATFTDTDGIEYVAIGDI